MSAKHVLVNVFQEGSLLDEIEVARHARATRIAQPVPEFAILQQADDVFRQGVVPFSCEESGFTMRYRLRNSACEADDRSAARLRFTENEPEALRFSRFNFHAWNTKGGGGLQVAPNLFGRSRSEKSESRSNHFAARSSSLRRGPSPITTVLDVRLQRFPR